MPARRGKQIKLMERARRCRAGCLLPARKLSVRFRGMRTRDTRRAALHYYSRVLHFRQDGLAFPRTAVTHRRTHRQPGGNTAIQSAGLVLRDSARDRRAEFFRRSPLCRTRRRDAVYRRVVTFHDTE